MANRRIVQLTPVAPAFGFPVATTTVGPEAVTDSSVPFSVSEGAGRAVPAAGAPEANPSTPRMTTAPRARFLTLEA
jgi:hypothetical protein